MTTQERRKETIAIIKCIHEKFQPGNVGDIGQKSIDEAGKKSESVSKTKPIISSDTYAKSSATGQLKLSNRCVRLLCKYGYIDAERPHWLPFEFKTEPKSTPDSKGEQNEVDQRPEKGQTETAHCPKEVQTETAPSLDNGQKGIQPSSSQEPTVTELIKRGIDYCSNNNINIYKRKPRFRWKVNDGAIQKLNESELRKKLIRIGYEEPQYCKSIFTILRKVFRSNRSKALTFALNSAICIGAFIKDYGKTDGYFSFYMLIVNVLLATTLFVYLTAADSVDDNLNSLRDAFSLDSQNSSTDSSSDSSPNFYARSCDVLYRWASFPPGAPSDVTFKGVHGEIRQRRQTARCVWCVFSVAWLAMSFYTVRIIQVETTACQHFSGIAFMFFFLMSMCCHSQSYYYSVLRICFYQKLTELPSKNEIEELPHNKIHPSQTSGFVQLLNSVNSHSTIFLINASLFIAAFIIVIHLRTPREPINIMANSHLFVIFAGVFLFSFLSTLIVSIGPKAMLKRILRIWVNKERKELQVEMDKKEREISKIDKEDKKSRTQEEESSPNKQLLLQEIQTLASRIDNLKDEKIESGGSFINLVISIVNLLAPVVAFLAAVYDKL